MRLTLAQIRDCLGAVGDLFEAEDMLVTRVATDSRLTGEGDLFVCLSGQKFDGHMFAHEAVRRGAGAILAQRPLPEIGGVPVLLVTDTLEALGRLAACWRTAAGAFVVAVTGSAGKTTVKEMIAAILSRDRTIAKNYKNYNNLIGVPLSMLAATGEEEAWVLECGISVKGEMERLGAMTAPDVALITNVGPAHLEGLGSLAGVAEAKCELLRHLVSGGQALVSQDYSELLTAARRIVPEPETFSTKDDGARFSCENLGGGRFLLLLDGERLEIAPPDAASHLAENLAAAAGAAYLAGASLETIKAGLEAPLAIDQRFRCCPCEGFLVIDDSYNANPLSMRRTIMRARELAGERPLYLVLGEMRELGGEACAAHQALGAVIAESGAAAVFYRGGHAFDLRQGLTEAGWPGQFVEVRSAHDFLAAWTEAASPCGVVLVKGSRGVRMEELGGALMKHLRGESGGRS